MKGDSDVGTQRLTWNGVISPKRNRTWLHPDLDDKLIETARKLRGHKTKREAVSRALKEYVQWLRQQAIVSEFGKIDYDPKYDYKKQRKVA